MAWMPPRGPPPPFVPAPGPMQAPPFAPGPMGLLPPGMGPPGAMRPLPPGMAPYPPMPAPMPMPMPMQMQMPPHMAVPPHPMMRPPPHPMMRPPPQWQPAPPRPTALNGTAPALGAAGTALPSAAIRPSGVPGLVGARPAVVSAGAAAASAAAASTAAAAAPNEDQLRLYQERQRKKEQVRLEDKKKAVVEQDQKRPADLPPPIPRSEKKTEWFLAKLKYKNSLPELPFDPKFIAYPFDPMRFVRYSTTSLEENFKFSMRTEGNMGLGIDLVDKDLYNPPTASDRQKLSGVDAMLAEDDAELDAQAKKRPESSSKVPWLRHTEFVATDPALVGSMRMFATPQRTSERLLSREDKVRLIKESFARVHDDASQAIEFKHPTKSGLQPAEVLPIFPDFATWGQDFLLMSFAGKPAHDGGLLVDYAQIAPDESEVDSQFGTRLLCKRKARELDEEDSGEAAPYTVAAKYRVRRDNNPRNYLFILQHQSAVFYHECPTQLHLAEHKMRDSVRDVTVQLHDESDAVLKERQRRAIEALHLTEEDVL